MKKIIPFLVCSTLVATAHASTVFSDDFNRASLGANYVTTRTAGDGGASIAGASFLELTNDATAAGNANGRLSAAVAFSGFATPFSATLDANAGLVTWETNLRYNRATEPGGFTGGTYGAAFVLAGTSADFTTGSGYAVLYGNSGSPDPFRLVRYTAGLTSESNFTVLASSGAADLASPNRYASLRVTLDPTSHAWSLFVRDDGATGWADPGTINAADQKGMSTTDAVLTGAGANLAYAGYLWNYSTATTQATQFDNLSVSVAAPAAVPEPTMPAALLAALGLGVVTRRRKRE